MSDNFENKESLNEEEEFSTVFSDPEEHKEKKYSDGNKKRINIIISSVLAAVVLVASSLAVIKLIPKLDEEEAELPFKDISVISEKETDIESVNITNQNGTFNFLNEKTETTDDDGDKTTEVSWYLPDMARDVISSDSISTIVSSATDITATRTVDTKSAADCGLETPVVKADIVSSKSGEYSVLIGDTSPDNTGVYLKLSNDEKIYIVDESEIEDLTFTLLDLADKSNFKPAEFEGDVSDYYEDNMIYSFDSLTLSGTNFPEKAVIVMEKDERFNLYTDYIFSSPVKRYADNLDSILSLYSEGLAASGSYSFDVSEESLKEFGLDNPDIVITLDIKGQLKTFKISEVDDVYCAVINENSKMIKKVSKSNLSFIDYGIENFYTSWISMQKMDDIKNLTVIGENEKSFDIVTNKEENSSSSTYDITLNGNKVDSEKFKDFYKLFITVNSLDYSVVNTAAKPDLTVKMTFSSDNLVRTVAFTKVAETKYQYSIDGVPLGSITSADYNKLVKLMNDIK